MNLQGIEAGIGVLEQDERLDVETNIVLRKNALDHLEFARAFALSHINTQALQERMALLRQRLLAIDTTLFTRFRTEIQQDHFTPDSLRAEFNQYTDYAPWKPEQPHIGPDGLDILVDGVLGYSGQFGRKAPTDPEMVHYEPTPARAILELIDKTRLNSNQVIYDLGSGIGRASILFTLLTGAQSKGIEIDPALTTFAQNVSHALRLNKVSFINLDAREADYSDGDMFFMFTPFLGNILQAVLGRLELLAQQRSITIGTFGRCTRYVAQEDWLKHVSGEVNNDFTLTVFQSR
jgi:hypothetical protein